MNQTCIIPIDARYSSTNLFWIKIEKNNAFFIYQNEIQYQAFILF